MARYGRRRFRLSLVASLVLAVAIGGPAPATASAAGHPRVRGVTSKAKKVAPAALPRILDAVAEAQRQLTADLAQLRDQLSELHGSVADTRGDVRQTRDAVQLAMKQIKGMREEVRGLYVESSGLKGDIAETGKQVDELGARLGSFRVSTGIVMAVVLVLQVVLVGLMFRGRRVSDD
ncbi:MAG: hypothetical protein ACE5I7_01475 [Candidatus Binatia bacterium]